MDKKNRKIHTVKVKCEDSEVDSVMKKIERLTELLKEANALIDELASKEIELKISV